MATRMNVEALCDPYIEGERIYLRALARRDATATYAEWMNESAINQFLESRFAHHDIASLQAFIDAARGDPLTLLAGIFLKGDERHIGNIKLGPINMAHRRGDIGLLIGDTGCWGKGFATEAIALISAFAFEQVGVHRLTAGAYADNEGSARAFERAGFHREGLLKDHWLTGDHFQDGVLLGKVNPAHAAPAA